jgi:hypothetical protein
MDEKGFRNPGQPKPRPNAPEPRGFDVFPGRYKIVLNYKGESDSTFIEIKDDPRLENRNQIKQAQRDMHARLRKSSEKIIEIMDRLTESEEVVNKIQNQIKGIEGKEEDSLRKAGVVTLDSLKKIREFISGTPDDRQGISRTGQVTVMTKVQQAIQYISSKNLAPGEQETSLVQMAEEAIAEAVEKSNQFYNGHWKKYQQQFQNTQIKLFPDYKPL